MRQNEPLRNAPIHQQKDLDFAAPFIAASKLSQVTFIGQGLDCIVFKGKSEEHEQVALKIPRTTIISCANDPNIDAREEMEQELGIYELFHGGPVPVPEAFELLEIDGHPSLLCEFVESDDSAVTPEELARVTALLHSAKLPDNWDVPIVAHEGEPDGLTALWKRVARRFNKLLEAEPDLADLRPAEGLLRQVADQLRRFPSCLNHMDLDVVNLRVRNGRITALIDWANAVVGPAAIDIGRILELGSSGPAFVEAYSRHAEYPKLSPVEETFLRLDAALMLALVFIWEAPNPEGRGPAVKRVEDLARALRA